MAGAQQFGVQEESLGDRTHVLAVNGDLDALNAPKLGRRLMRLTSGGRGRIVVDLSATTFIDSTGLGVILDALRHLAGDGDSGFALVCPTKRVMRPFEVAGLTSRLDIFGSREDALGGLAHST